MKAPFDFNITYFIYAFLFCVMLGAGCHPVAANTDYYDHYLSQQISLEELSRIEQEADEAWIAENGEYQPNLTPEAAQYLQSEAEKIQEQRNVRK